MRLDEDESGDDVHGRSETIGLLRRPTIAVDSECPSRCAEMRISEHPPNVLSGAGLARRATARARPWRDLRRTGPGHSGLKGQAGARIAGRNTSLPRSSVIRACPATPAWIAAIALRLASGSS